MLRFAIPALLALAMLGTTTCGNVGVAVCGGWWCVSWTPPPPPCSTCSYPTTVTTADFDGDGNVDVAAAARGAQGVAVLFGDGQGGVRDEELFQEALGPSAGIVLAGLFDGDEFPDVAVIDVERSQVRLLRGDGAGRFGSAGDPIAAGAAGRIVAAAAARVDADDRDDIVLVDNAGLVVVLAPDTFGRMVAAPLSVPRAIGPGTADLAVGHVDTDGNVDLLVLDRSTDSVVVLLGDGLGGFVPVSDHVLTGPVATAIAGGEFDGVPGMDVAVLDANDGSIRLHFSNADGTFSPSPQGPIPLPSPYGVGLLAVPDPSRPDGPADLAALFADESTAILLVGLANDGSGFFGLPSRTIAVGTAERMAHADLDGDGRTDLVLANPTLRSVGFAMAGSRDD